MTLYSFEIIIRHLSVGYLSILTLLRLKRIRSSPAQEYKTDMYIRTCTSAISVSAVSLPLYLRIFYSSDDTLLLNARLAGMTCMFINALTLNVFLFVTLHINVKVFED